LNEVNRIDCDCISLCWDWRRWFSSWSTRDLRRTECDCSPWENHSHRRSVWYW